MNYKLKFQTAFFLEKKPAKVPEKIFAFFDMIHKTWDDYNFLFKLNFNKYLASILLYIFNTPQGFMY